MDTEQYKIDIIKKIKNNKPSLLNSFILTQNLYAYQIYRYDFQVGNYRQWFRVFCYKNLHQKGNNRLKYGTIYYVNRGRIYYNIKARYSIHEFIYSSQMNEYLIVLSKMKVK